MVNIPHWPKIPIWDIPRKPSLDLSFKLLELMGNPHKKLPHTIHIAGTNGKGSTLAMLKSIFVQAGYKVHSYTSPHLLEFNERINLTGQSITDSHLYDVLERTKIVADKHDLSPTFFEGATAAAFLAFSENDADILLLETGLGGRLDCTNVIQNPIATIITPISYDHMEYLGSDILQIASEKAGIIKRNVPCIIGIQESSVYELLINKCDELSSPSFCYEYDYCAKNTNSGFEYKSQKFNIHFPYPSLEGDHQVLNASTVIAAITLLNDKFKVTTSQIIQGLTSTTWHGRLQLVDKEKTKALTVRDNIQIYLDGAHNDAAAASLANWAKGNIEGNLYLLVGMTRNRYASSFCRYFKDVATHGFAVNVESEPSSYSADIMAEKARESGIEFTSADSITDALQKISTLNKKDPTTILVTGSLFLISDFMKL